METSWQGTQRNFQVTADTHRNWWVAGQIRPDLTGCSDVDIELTPATNTLPIRRLGLADGETREIEVAWVRLPEHLVIRSRQAYSRLSENLYRFRSIGTGWEADLRVNSQGLVTDYPGGWVLAPPGSEPSEVL